MWKDDASNTGNCPAIYKTEDGYVVQGKVIDGITLSQLRDLGDDEMAVFVPANVIDRIKVEG